MLRRQWERSKLFRGCVAVLAAMLALLLVNGSALATEAAPAQPAAMERDPRALEILMRMAGYLAKAQALGVTVVSGYDAIQADGERIEFGEKRRIELQRPDHIRVDVERSDGDHGLLLFDGKAITAFKHEDNIYAVVEKPGTVDSVLVHLVKDLQIAMPLARMFLTTFPANLEEQVREIAYVETCTLLGVSTDHLAVRGPEVDFQVWITQGDAPLPRRVIITYRDAPGQPQFRAYLSEWTVGAAPAADRYAFTPPAGAEKVPFIIPSRGPKQTPPTEGGAK